MRSGGAQAWSDNSGVIGLRLVYRSQDESVTAVSSERVNLRATYLLTGNRQTNRIVVRYVNWVFWLLVAWIAVSATVAIIIVGRVIRARDKREMPPGDQDNNDEGWRDAG